MKCLYTIFALILSTSIFAQTKYPEPEFSNTPVWFDASSGTLKNLERLPANQGARPTGMMSAETLVFFPGITSSIQFDVNKFPVILVKMNSPNEDPFGSIEIVKMQVNKKKQQREYILGKVSLGGGKSTINTIELDFKRINTNGVYQIVPSIELTKGEYVFVNSLKKPFLLSLVGEKKGGESESIEGRTYEQYKQKQKEINDNPSLSPDEKKRLTKEEHDRQSEMENRAFVKAREERNRRNDSIAAANSKMEESNLSPKSNSTTPKAEPVKAAPSVKEETKITPPKPVYQEPIKEEVKIVTPVPIETTPTPAKQVKVTYSRTEEIPAAKPTPTPVPVAPATKSVSDSEVEELKKWKKMLDAGVITQAEYDAKKKQVLGN